MVAAVQFPTRFYDFDERITQPRPSYEDVLSFNKSMSRLKERAYYGDAWTFEYKTPITLGSQRMMMTRTLRVERADLARYGQHWRLIAGGELTIIPETKAVRKNGRQGVETCRHEAWLTLCDLLAEHNIVPGSMRTHEGGALSGLGIGFGTPKLTWETYRYV